MEHATVKVRKPFAGIGSLFPPANPGGLELRVSGLVASAFTPEPSCQTKALYSKQAGYFTDSREQVPAP